MRIETDAQKQSPDPASHPESSPVNGKRMDEEEFVVIVPARQDLKGFDDEANIDEIIITAIEELSCQTQWLTQYNAILTMRRLLLSHAAALQPHLELQIPMFLLCVDSLRSSLSKNALLLLAECFQTFSIHVISPFMKPRQSNLLETLLRRAACEKKFLREAALYSSMMLVQYQATMELLVSLASFSSSKSPKICSLVATLLHASLVTMHLQGCPELEQTATNDDSAEIGVICKSLVELRSGRDPKARKEAFDALRELGSAIGEKTLGILMAKWVPNKNIAVRVTRDAFDARAKPASPVAAQRLRVEGASQLPKRSTLRERMMMHSQNAQTRDAVDMNE